MQNELKYKKIVARMRLLDDDFMSKVFDKQIPATQYLLDVILNHNGLKVQSVVSQREIKATQGRSVRLDIVAKDAEGKMYDIEVQRADHGAGVKRARFNSSLMDTKLLNVSEDFDALPETYVIFITENDVFKCGKPILHIERTIKETQSEFGDGTHIVYVNSTITDPNTELGRLMHDFRCTNASDMFESPLKERVKYFKETEEGNNIMCKAVEKVYLDGFNKGESGERKRTLDAVSRLVKSGIITSEQAEKEFSLSESEKSLLSNKDSSR